MARGAVREYVDDTWEVSDFWNEFEYQNATFNGDAGSPRRGGKKFMPGEAYKEINIAGRPGDATPIHTGPSGGVVRRVAGSGAAAQAAYNVSLFLNRNAIVYQAKRDVALKLGDSIRRLCPPRGQGGALISYGLTVSKKRDGMGQHVASYTHKLGLLGIGPDSLAVYQRIFNNSYPTIGKGSRVYKMPDPNSVPVICYFWVFRAE